MLTTFVSMLKVKVLKLFLSFLFRTYGIILGVFYVEIIIL